MSKKRLSLISISLFFISIAVLPAIAQEAEWEDISSPGPSNRAGHAMVYDNLNKLVVLFGGDAWVNGVHEDYACTWLWNGNSKTWIDITPPDVETKIENGEWPHECRAAGMAYDEANNVAVLFGGTSGVGSGSILFNDTWILDCTSHTWMRATILGDPPEPRHGPTLAYDSIRGVTVLFGGCSQGFYYYPETWEFDLSWDGSSWIGTWTKVNFGGPDSPPGRTNHSSAFDGVNGIVIFGGVSHAFGEMPDTWIWDGSNWTEKTSGPSAREGSSMAYDSESGVVILFGGGDDDLHIHYDDTWKWDGYVESWYDVSSPGPSKRAYHEMVFDNFQNKVVLFGGLDKLVSPFDYKNDTWEYGPVCVENEIIATDPDGAETYCASIQEAVDLVDAEGWVITVGSGVYDEYVIVSDKTNLTIKTACGAQVQGFKLLQCDGVTIEGFTINPEGTGKHGVAMPGGISHSSNVTVRDCDIFGADNSYSGIKAYRGNTNIQIENNHIHHNGRNGVAFADAAGGPHFLTGNLIEENGWNGVRVPYGHVTTLTGNTIKNNGTKTGITGGRYGVLRVRVSGGGRPEEITLINNIVINNNGKIIAGQSSLDLGNYDQMLDETDSGNTTTSGDEGPGVE